MREKGEVPALPFGNANDIRIDLVEADRISPFPVTGDDANPQPQATDPQIAGARWMVVESQSDSAAVRVERRWQDTQRVIGKLEPVRGLSVSELIGAQLGFIGVDLPDPRHTVKVTRRQQRAGRDGSHDQEYSESEKHGEGR